MVMGNTSNLFYKKVLKRQIKKNLFHYILKYYSHQNKTFEYPKLSTCHQNVFFIWLPCFVFWVLFPFWIYSLCGKKFFTLKTSILLILKNVNYFLNHHLIILNWIKCWLKFLLKKILTVCLIINETANFVMIARNYFEEKLACISSAILILSFVWQIFF